MALESALQRSTLTRDLCGWLQLERQTANPKTVIFRKVTLMNRTLSICALATFLTVMLTIPSFGVPLPVAGVLTPLPFPGNTGSPARDVYLTRWSQHRAFHGHMAGPGPRYSRAAGVVGNVLRHWPDAAYASERATCGWHGIV